MGADEIAQAARRYQAVTKRRLAARRAQERRFWIGVACAAVLHAALFVGIGGSLSPRQLGDPGASPDGIAVELVDAADLVEPEHRGPDNPPLSTGSVAPQPQPQQPPAEAGPLRHPSPRPHRHPRRRPQRSRRHPSSYRRRNRQEADQARRHPPRARRCRGLRTRWSWACPIRSFSPPGRSAAFARPPGITRSGENDEFGRGVIRALRRTMPGSDRLGQVTIRLFLSETGNIVEVRLDQERRRSAHGPECRVRGEAGELPDPARRRHDGRPHLPGDLRLSVSPLPFRRA